MKGTVLVSGATGFIGVALCCELRACGYSVRTLSRRRGDFSWDRDLESGRALDGVDAVIHLAGEPVAQHWSPCVKRRILESRVRGTEQLVRAILKREGKPPVFISASGIHYYGFHRGTGLNESSPAGPGFLAEVCHQWERAARPLTDAGVRVVHIRTGIVLHARGGALSKLLPVFRLGLGGRIASGRQWMSWISLPDIVRIYLAALRDERLMGPVNAVAPAPIQNAEFTRTLARVLRRPALFPVPSALLRLLYGDMAKEMILSDLGVSPQVLETIGFQWETADVAAALAACLD